jgi:uncharacterized protein YceK
MSARTKKLGTLGLLLGLALGASTGCASVGGMLLMPGTPYAGTRLDASLVCDGELFGFLDMPGSVVLDTVTLPVAFARDTQGPNLMASR